MKYSFIKSFGICLLLHWLFACGNKTAAPEKSYSDTSLLQAYLVEMRGEGIGEETHLYVVVPSQGCFGCMQRSLIAFKPYLDSNLASQTTLIVSNKNKDVLASIPAGINKINDSLSKIDRLDLKLGNVKFIITKMKEVTANEQFAPAELNLLPDFLKKEMGS